MWKAGAMDEGEHLGAFYRPAKEGGPGRQSVHEVNDGGECSIQVFCFGSGLKG
jgi:hypothetical protein